MNPILMYALLDFSGMIRRTRLDRLTSWESEEAGKIEGQFVYPNCWMGDIYIHKWYISQLLKEKFGWVGWVIAISNDLLESLDVIHVPPLWSDDLGDRPDPPWAGGVSFFHKHLICAWVLFVTMRLGKIHLMTWDGEGYVCHIIRCQFLGRLDITSRSCLLDLASICDCNLLYNIRIYIYLQITVYDIILSLQRRTFTSWSFSRLIEAHGAKNLRLVDAKIHLATFPFRNPHRTFDSGEVLYPRDQFDAGLDVSSDTICDVMRRL